MMFAAITPASALAVLRDILNKIGVANAESYRTHDFRRGHAQDLVESGCNCAYCQHMFIPSVSNDCEVRRSGSFWPRANGGHRPS